jgi:hypothetical protein
MIARAVFWIFYNTAFHHLFPLGPVGHLGEGVVGGVDAEVRERRVCRHFGLDLQGGALRLRGPVTK